MLSKEEIEISDIEIAIPLNTKLLEREYRDLYIRHKIMLGEKQNLIEKLEKDKYTIESKYSQINGDYFMAQDKLDYIKEILDVLKGENHEHI